MTLTTSLLAIRLAVAERVQGTGVASRLAAFVAGGLNQPVVGTIEADNVRSWRTARSVGGERLAVCEARILTHKRRPSPHVQQGQVDRLPPDLAPLVAQVDPADLWTYRTAGTFLLAHRWQVTTLGGPLGRALLPLLRLAGIRAEQFDFLSAHGCWGEPADLQTLLSAALHHHDAAAVSLVSTNGTARQRLHAQMRLGVAGRLVGVSRWDVVGSPGATWSLFEPIAAR
jgi:hypothetical protein